MFNGYNEAPLIYNDFEQERGKKQQNAIKWPYGHKAGLQTHPANQSELWSPKASFLKFPNVLSISSKCGCSGCYPSGENQGVEGDAARHRPWFHRSVAIPSNGSDDPSKLVGAHRWENVNSSQEKSCSVGETLDAAPRYLHQENGEKSSFHRPYVGSRLSEAHQPGVITSAKSAETSRKDESSKRPEEIITSPSGQEILLLGQKGVRQLAGGSFPDESAYSAGKKDSDLDFHDRKEKYFNAESSSRINNNAPCSTDQSALLHSAVVEPYGKTVPFHPSQNRVPSIGHLSFKDSVSESYLDQTFHDAGKSIRTNHQIQSYGQDKNCRNAFQTAADPKLSESKMETVQNGHANHLPSVYGNYLDYPSYHIGLKGRDFTVPFDPAGGSESQKLHYYNNKKSGGGGGGGEYLARNFFPDATRKSGSSLYEESKRDCMVNANSGVAGGGSVGIHEQYLGALGRSNHHVLQKYWEAGNGKVSSCGIYYPNDSGSTDKRSKGESKYLGSEGMREPPFDRAQRNDPVSNPTLPHRMPPHPSIYAGSDPPDLRYVEKDYGQHPFRYQTNTSTYKNFARAEYPYPRYNHQTHFTEYPHGAPNAFQVPELGNPNQYNLKAYQNSAAGCPGFEQYFPRSGGGPAVFEPQCQQIGGPSKQYPQSYQSYDPNIQSVLHSSRADVQSQPLFATNEPPGLDRRPELQQASRSKSGYLETIRSEDVCRSGGTNNNNKISPLRLLRKKKFSDAKIEPEKGAILRNSSSAEERNPPALDVRRFWATWAEEEDDPNASQTQMVVLDCQDIDPEQAEWLRFYEPEPVRTLRVEGTDMLTVKNPVGEQRLEFGPNESKTDFGVVGNEKTSLENKTEARNLSDFTVDSFVGSEPSEKTKKTEEKVEIPENLVKESSTENREAEKPYVPPEKDSMTRPSSETVSFVEEPPAPVSAESDDRSGKISPSHSKLVKKCSSKSKKPLTSTAFSEETAMDKWTEKKFDFLKRAEESKAAELARNEQEKKKILDNKKLYKHIAFGNKVSCAAEKSTGLPPDSSEAASIVSESDPLEIPDEIFARNSSDNFKENEGKRNRSDSSCSQVFNTSFDQMVNAKSSDAGLSESLSDLPTSEYRKNKFLDYSVSDVLLRGHRQTPTSDVSENIRKNLEAKPRIEEEEKENEKETVEKSPATVTEPKSKEKAEPVLEEEMNEILEKISLIKFDTPDCLSLDEPDDVAFSGRDSLKSEKQKKPKKITKKFKKSNHEEIEKEENGTCLSKPKLKFSIRKLQDLKISFKVMNAGSATGRTEQELAPNSDEILSTSKESESLVPDSSKTVKDLDKSERRLKKKRTRCKTPIVKIKEIPLPRSEIIDTRESENGDKILDLSKQHRQEILDRENLAQDFRVHEILDSSKIKLTFKRRKILSEDLAGFEIKDATRNAKANLHDFSEKESSFYDGDAIADRNVLPDLLEEETLGSEPATNFFGDAEEEKMQMFHKLDEPGPPPPVAEETSGPIENAERNDEESAEIEKKSAEKSNETFLMSSNSVDDLETNGVEQIDENFSDTNVPEKRNTVIRHSLDENGTGNLCPVEVGENGSIITKVTRKDGLIEEDVDFISDLSVEKCPSAAEKEPQDPNTRDPEILSGFGDLKKEKSRDEKLDGPDFGRSDEVLQGEFANSTGDVSDSIFPTKTDRKRRVDRDSIETRLSEMFGQDPFDLKSESCAHSETEQNPSFTIDFDRRKSLCGDSPTRPDKSETQNLLSDLLIEKQTETEVEDGPFPLDPGEKIFFQNEEERDGENRLRENRPVLRQESGNSNRQLSAASEDEKLEVEFGRVEEDSEPIGGDVRFEESEERCRDDAEFANVSEGKDSEHRPNLEGIEENRDDSFSDTMEICEPEEVAKNIEILHDSLPVFSERTSKSKISSKKNVKDGLFSEITEEIRGNEKSDADTKRLFETVANIFRSNKRRAESGRCRSLPADNDVRLRFVRSKSLPPETTFHFETDQGSPNVPDEVNFLDVPVCDIPLPVGEPPEKNIFRVWESFSKKEQGNQKETPSTLLDRFQNEDEEKISDSEEEGISAELKPETSLMISGGDEDDCLRFPLPSPTLSDASSGSASFSGREFCGSPFVLSGFDKFRNPSPPCAEEEPVGERKTPLKHPRLDCIRKDADLRNPSPPSSKLGSDSPVSTEGKSESEELFALVENVEPLPKISSPVPFPGSIVSQEKQKFVVRGCKTKNSGNFRVDPVRTPSPLRPENRLLYGTDCPLSKESIEEGTRLSESFFFEKSRPETDESENPPGKPEIRTDSRDVVKDREGSPIDRIEGLVRCESSFRPKSIDDENSVAETEQKMSVDFEDAIFVTEEFTECQGVISIADTSNPLPAVDEIEEEKVTDDKFHDVMQNCLENAKKFLSVGHLRLFSCSVEDLFEMETPTGNERTNPGSDDRISRDVLLSSCDEPAGTESAFEETFRSAEISEDISPSFEIESARDLCPEFLPVDNWPYLEEEVPMSPTKSKADGSEISSPPLENVSLSDNPVCLFDPLKNLPDSRNVIPAYLNDKSLYFGSRNSEAEETKEEIPSEPSGCNGLRRRSLVLEPSAFSAYSVSSSRRRKTIDGIAGNYLAEANAPNRPEFEKASLNSSKNKKDLKCRLSLERLSLKKNDESKEEIQTEIKGGKKETVKSEQKSDNGKRSDSRKDLRPIDKGYLSQKWQPKVILSRISDKELKEKRRIGSIPKIESSSEEVARVQIAFSSSTEQRQKSHFLKNHKTSTPKPNPEKTFQSNKTEKMPRLRNGLSIDRIETSEEKIRKKPRFRNLHTKKKRRPGEKESVNSESDSDGPRPRKSLDPKKASEPSESAGEKNQKTRKRSRDSEDNSKNKSKDSTFEKIKLKKTEISLDFSEKKTDYKSKSKIDPDSCKVSNKSDPTESTLQGIENPCRKKSGSKGGHDDLSSPEKIRTNSVEKKKENQICETDKNRKNSILQRKGKRKVEKLCSAPWICQVCGFSDQAQRSLHIKTHAFHCQSCHLAFKTEACFTDHLTQRHKDIKNQHHCLLCELSFDREADHRNHLESREHKHLESVEKNTINTLFTLLTGQPCPVLGPVEIRPEWLPSQAGTVHFYHQATPLSLALQYLKMRHESCSFQSK